MEEKTKNSIEEKKRTLRQNASIHLYLTWVSTALNSAGFSVEEVLKNYTIELNWTPEIAKEILWRTAMKRMTGKQSTTELLKTSGEINDIHMAISRFLGERLKIEPPPFPNEADMIKLDELKRKNHDQTPQPKP